MGTRKKPKNPSKAIKAVQQQAQANANLLAENAKKATEAILQQSAQSIGQLNAQSEEMMRRLQQQLEESQRVQQLSESRIREYQTRLEEMQREYENALAMRDQQMKFFMDFRESADQAQNLETYLNLLDKLAMRRFNRATSRRKGVIM
jgi:uncharacterized protein (DUF849 family)